MDIPDVDLRFPNGNRENLDDADHSNGLLERREEHDFVTVQEPESRAARGSPNHSLLCERTDVLGDRQLPHEKQETFSRPSSTSLDKPAETPRSQHSRESQSQISIECEHPSAIKDTRVRIGRSFIVRRRSNHPNS